MMPPGFEFVAPWRRALGRSLRSREPPQRKQGALALAVALELALAADLLLLRLAALALVDERLVDVRDHTTAGDRRLDQRIELLITTDGELQVARSDALDLFAYEVHGGKRLE